jgi:hypothetical protein
LRKTGQFQKNGGNKSRNPNNRQGNSSGQSNQNSNSRNSSSRKPNQNSNSSSRNSGAGGNAGSRKKGIHPWVSSGPSSSQALTSHISMVSNRSSAEGGNGGNSRNKPQGQKRRNPSRQQRDNGNNGRPRNHQNQHDKAKRSNNAPSAAKAVSSGAEQKLTGDLDAFSLFCAYHLGIGPNKEYKPSNINEVARRFGQDQGVVKQALKECNMDSAALLDKDFDMALAQLDIQVAPEGIDKMELAKSIYEDFLEAPNVKRDWKKIIEEDRKENRKIFG